MNVRNADPSRYSYYVTDEAYGELVEDFLDWQSEDRAIEDVAERDMFRRLVEREARILDRLLLEDWLKRVWYQRETVTFSVAQPDANVAPGAIVKLPGNASELLITGIEEGLVRRVSARQIAFVVPTPWREEQSQPAKQVAIMAGQPHALFLDLPSGVGEGTPAEQFRVAVWQKP